MVVAVRWVLTVVVAVAPATWAQAQYSVKSVKADPPADVNASLRKQVGDNSVQFLDGKGNVICQLWFANAVPADATPEQIKNGLTYRELKETALMGVAKFEQAWSDYRKQKIKPGVYTLRLAFQPMDGDHMGTAPFGEFVLLVPAENDDGKDELEAEKLVDLSKKASGTGHPAVFLLFPVDQKELNKAPVLAKKMGNNWVLSVTRKVRVGGKEKGVIGIGLTLIGFSPSA